MYHIFLIAVKVSIPTRILNTDLQRLQTPLKKYF